MGNYQWPVNNLVIKVRINTSRERPNILFSSNLYIMILLTKTKEITRKK